jgi:hypothetical protein
MNTYFEYLSTQEKIFLFSGLVGALCFLLYAVLIILMSAFQKKGSGAKRNRSEPYGKAQKLPPWLRWKLIKSIFSSWMMFGVVGLALSRLLNAGQGASLLGAIMASGLTMWMDFSVGETQVESNSA